MRNNNNVLSRYPPSGMLLISAHLLAPFFLTLLHSRVVNSLPCFRHVLTRNTGRCRGKRWFLCFTLGGQFCLRSGIFGQQFLLLDLGLVSLAGIRIAHKFSPLFVKTAAKPSAQIYCLCQFHHVIFTIYTYIAFKTNTLFMVTVTNYCSSWNKNVNLLFLL